MKKRYSNLSLRSKAIFGLLGLMLSSEPAAYSAQAYTGSKNELQGIWYQGDPPEKRNK